MKTFLRAFSALSIITAAVLATSPSSYAVANTAPGAGQDGSSLVPSTVLPGIESDILKYINSHRVDAGSPAFSESSSADEMARSFSVSLVKSGIFSQDQPGLAYGQRLEQSAPCGGDPCSEAAESIYQIDYPSMQDFLADVQNDEQIDKMAKDIVDGWIANPGHRRYIEDPLLESVGIGVAVSTDGKLYATVDFVRSTPLTDQQFRQTQGMGLALGPPPAPARMNTGGAQPPQP